MWSLLPYLFTNQGQDMILEELFMQTSYSSARTCPFPGDTDHSHCLINITVVSYTVSVRTGFSRGLCTVMTHCVNMPDSLTTAQTQLIYLYNLSTSPSGQQGDLRAAFCWKKGRRTLSALFPLQDWLWESHFWLSSLLTKISSCLSDLWVRTLFF